MKQYHENLEQLTPNQYWLLEHQITAFWHGFGISNDLWGIPESMVNYDEKEKTYTINKQYMQQKLKRYIGWLKQYRKSWDSKAPHPFKIDTLNKMIRKDCHIDTRKDILKMISLLQNNKE